MGNPLICEVYSQEKEKTSGKTTTTTTTTTLKHSLWLVPPDPLSIQISKQIKELAVMNNSPSFSPHITLVGGIEIDENGDIDKIMEELKSGLLNSSTGGGIPCTFNRSKGFVTSYSKKDNNIVVWSQASVGIIERNETLLEAFHTAKRILYDSKQVANSWHPLSDFSPPLSQPHMSFAYKSSTVEMSKDLEQLPEDFIAHKLVLMKTDPSSVEGVSTWEEVSSFLI